MYFQYEDDYRELNTVEELEEYLAWSDQNEWIEPYTYEVGAVGIPSAPIVQYQYCSNVRASAHRLGRCLNDADLDHLLEGIFKGDLPDDIKDELCRHLIIQVNGSCRKLQDIDPRLPENEACINGSGIFLSFPYHNRIDLPVPTRNLAFAGILDRAGFHCPAMKRQTPARGIDLLPVQEKASVISRGNSLNRKTCKILVQDGMVTDIHSDVYAIIPERDLLSSLAAWMEKEHPSYAFMRACASYEAFAAEYALCDEFAEGEMRERLRKFGYEVNNLNLCVRLTTSNVGESCVRLACYYDADGVIFGLGSGIAMRHRGEASIERFENLLSGFARSASENEDRIEELGLMRITNVAKTVEAVRNSNKNMFPKASCDSVIEGLEKKYPYGGNGIDVYLALHEIILGPFAVGSFHPARYIQAVEQLEGMMRLPFDRIDKGISD